MLALLLSAALLPMVAGCVDYDEPGEDRVVGLRGYPCMLETPGVDPALLDTCSDVLFCLEVQGETLCSGPRKEGQSCFTDDDCEYAINDIGLPLFCAANVCAYPSAGQAAP